MTCRDDKQTLKERSSGNQKRTCLLSRWFGCMGCKITYDLAPDEGASDWRYSRINAVITHTKSWTGIAAAPSNTCDSGRWLRGNAESACGRAGLPIFLLSSRGLAHEEEPSLGGEASRGVVGVWRACWVGLEG